MRAKLAVAVMAACLGASSPGCRSPFYADQGAAVGGLTGAGVGALVGSQSKNALPGALIGGAVGAVSGGLIGGAIDDVEAKNRAAINQQMGRLVPTGGVSIDDVLSMVASGVDEELIVTHIRSNGMVAPIGATELITLQQQGVSKAIIQAMQTSPPKPRMQTGAPAGYGYGPPVIVEEHFYGPPPVYYGPPCWGPPRYRHGPRVGWGVSISN